MALIAIPLYLAFLVLAAVAIFGWAFVRIFYFRVLDWWKKTKRKR